MVGQKLLLLLALVAMYMAVCQGATEAPAAEATGAPGGNETHAEGNGTGEAAPEPAATPAPAPAVTAAEVPMTEAPTAAPTAAPTEMTDVTEGSNADRNKEMPKLLVLAMLLARFVAA